jgi:hypothetical protein
MITLCWSRKPLQGDLYLGLHCNLLTVYLAQQNTAVSSVVTEHICRENWFLDVSLVMEMRLLRNGL